MPSNDMMRRAVMATVDDSTMTRYANMIDDLPVKDKMEKPIYGKVGRKQKSEDPDFLTSQALSQDEADLYERLSRAYKGGIQLPLAIQLHAYRHNGELPTGINLDHEALDGMSVVEWLTMVVPLQTRKTQFGVRPGVVDFEAAALMKSRVAVIFTRCGAEQAEAEVMGETVSRMVFFPTPDGATLNKRGNIPLFPGYPDSPVGQFRGDGASFSVNETVDFVIRNFPDIIDEFDKAIDTDS